MTTFSEPELQLVAFGDLEQGVWGAAWGGAEPFLVVGTLAAAASADPAVIEGTDTAADWRLEGNGLALILAAEGDAVAAPPELGGCDQLCRVHGTAVLGGAERTVECLGRRGVRTVPPLRELGSIRDFSAWFSPTEGLALTALRPRDAEGHDHDLIAAGLFEDSGGATVADPLFSTTYGADGLPARVSLELWLEAEDDGESYPRRVAGVALAGAAASGGDLDVHASVFRCFTRGLEGLGVYILARVT
jgi:hypothetical protein